MNDLIPMKREAVVCAIKFIHFFHFEARDQTNVKSAIEHRGDLNWKIIIIIIINHPNEEARRGLEWREPISGCVGSFSYVTESFCFSLVDSLAPVFVCLSACLPHEKGLLIPPLLWQWDVKLLFLLFFPGRAPFSC